MGTDWRRVQFGAPFPHLAVSGAIHNVADLGDAPTERCDMSQRSRTQHRRGHRVVIAVAAAALLTLAACGSTSGGETSSGPAKPGGTLMIGEDSQPLSGLDPIMAQAFNAKRMVSQFYEAPMSLGKDGKTIEPAIATKWEQVSPLQLKLTLREGVLFHNGEEMTADDVVFSLNRIVDPDQNSPYSALYNFKNIEATGPNEVTINLSKPQASLLHLLAQPWSAGIVDQSWVEATDVDAQKTQENGTGPFMLKEFREGSLISTVRFDGYWESDRPYLDGVEYRLMADESTRVQALSSGAIDMAQMRTPKNADALKNKKMEVGPSYDLSYWVGLNLNKGALANEKVRQAISLGLDREQLIEIGSQGVGVLAYTVPPADSLGTEATKDTPYYAYDIEKAEKLLAESGETDITLKLITQAENPATLATAQLMSEQLSQIGIKLEVQSIPFGTLVNRLFTKGWEGTDMIVLNAALNADASQYLDLWFAKGAPQTSVDDSKLWQMMDDAITTEEGNEDRKARYLEISEYIAEKAYQIVPYASPSAFDVWNPKLQGFEADSSGTRIFLKNAWMG